MKKLMLLVFVLSSLNAWASGCDDGDYRLVREKKVFKIGMFDLSYDCYTTGCMLYGSRIANGTNISEYHILRSESDVNENIRKKQKAVLNMYYQVWTGSCENVIRYTIGIDIHGMRFRQDLDLVNLNEYE